MDTARGELHMIFITAPLFWGVLVGFGIGALAEAWGIANPEILIRLAKWEDRLFVSCIALGVGIGSIILFGLYAAGIGMHWGPKGLTPVTDIVGGALFGIGLAISGYFPGSIWMALGEGRRDAVFAVAGALLGAATWTALYQSGVGIWMHNVIDLGPRILLWDAKPPVIVGISPLAIFGIAVVYGIIMLVIAYRLPRFRGGKASCLMNAIGRAAGRVGGRARVTPSPAEAEEMEDTKNALTEGGLPYRKGSLAWKINNYYAVEGNVYAWFMVLIGTLIGLIVIIGITFHQIFGESTTDSWLAGLLWMPNFKYSQIVFKTIGWEPLSDIGTFLGAFFTATVVTKRFTAFKPIMPPSWRNRFGDSWIKRAFGSFIGAYLMLFGARMADGCASGHILSGFLQMADSGIIFGITVIVFAVITARLVYGHAPSRVSFRGTINEKETEEWVARLEKGNKVVTAAIVIGVIATVLVAAFATGFSTTYAIPPTAVALTAIIPILLLLGVTAYYSRTPITIDGQVVDNYEPGPATEKKQ